ncbi:hypothetical protein PBOI14_43120 [Pseudomonas sp. Boi14]|nr:hypothetical protein PBOI14_43120 [Pseudomonas sp. Boi14]
MFQLVMTSLDGDLLLALLVALLLTWMCHSSVAVVLLIASLAGTGLLSPATSMALVLGSTSAAPCPRCSAPAATWPGACPWATCWCACRERRC